MDQIVRAKWWRVPADEVPRSADHEAQVRWLYDWWKRIDTWISENRPNGRKDSKPAAAAVRIARRVAGLPRVSALSILRPRAVNSAAMVGKQKCRPDKRIRSPSGAAA